MMSAEELRGAVDHQIGAVLQRPAKHRGGKGVIDAEQHPVATGNAGQAIQIRHHD
jgi:hypothetical protein